MQSRNKIPLVDDNTTNIAILEEVLAEKYSLKSAITGQQAWRSPKSFALTLFSWTS